MGSPTRRRKIVEPFSLGGSIKKSVVSFAGPTAYTTGGDVLNAADCGLTWFTSVKAICITGDLQVNPIFATDAKVKSVLFMIMSNAGVEVGAGSNQSGKIFIVEAEGVG